MQTHDPPMKANRIIQGVFVFVFLIAGPIPLAIGAVWTWNMWNAYQESEGQLADWIEVEAEITDCFPSTYDPYSRSRSYPWRMEYTDPAGQVHRGEDVGASCVPGARYRMRCDPADLDHCSQFAVLVPHPLILCFIGCFTIGIAVKEWLEARREKKPSATLHRG